MGPGESKACGPTRPWSSGHTLEGRLDCSGECCRSTHVSERFILRVPRERWCVLALGQRPYGQPAGGGRRRCAHRNMPLSNMRWRLLLTLLLHGWIVGAVNITFQLAEQCALQADCANLCAPAFECTDTSQ
jgi:hypothetical protein